MRTRLLAAIAAGAVSIPGLAACASTPAPGEPTQSSPAGAASTPTPTPTPTQNPYGIGTIDPPPPGQPVLTVSGGNTPLALTLDQLNELGRTTVALDEPFVKRRETYSGVPLAVVLGKAGIPDSATVDTVGLDDYHYVSAAKPMIESRALIATQRDGTPIPYDQGGPIRIVFPDGTPLSSVLDAWNWSLAAIKVKTPGGPAS
ncbi:molybdopterin-dependent oxidoreductase [Mycolicibacterium sphagni]|nr:molybdopterin-dependent oxidoreductase [Mycolicibacterium sphagni]